MRTGAGGRKGRLADLVLFVFVTTFVLFTHDSCSIRGRFRSSSLPLGGGEVCVPSVPVSLGNETIPTRVVPRRFLSAVPLPPTGVRGKAPRTSDTRPGRREIGEASSVWSVTTGSPRVEQERGPYVGEGIKRRSERRSKAHPSHQRKNVPGRANKTDVF